ncbi:hypothetical protein OROGR_010123 [Orobanche gracilis]
MRKLMRNLALKTREKIMTVPTKEKKRELRREKKAEEGAVLEKSIEMELLERLKNGSREIVNVPVDKYIEILNKEVPKEPEIEYDEGFEGLEEEDDIEDFGGLAIREYDDSDDDNEMDEEEEEETVPVDCKRGRHDFARKLKKAEPDAKSKKKAKVQVEVEREVESAIGRQRLML